MKKYACFLLVFFHLTSAFSFEANPAEWSQGALYEKTIRGSIIYLYINPSGEFTWIRDEQYLGIISVKGQWKRNPLTGLLKFFAQNLNSSIYLRDPLDVRPHGLFKRTSDSPIFIPASEQALKYMLPQVIESYALPPHRDYNFYTVRDIGVNHYHFPWMQEKALDADAFEVIKKLRKQEYSAQQAANEVYQKERNNRLKWSASFSNAYSAGRRLFSTVLSDSAKLRAMCNWIDDNIKYDDEASLLNNKDHSPEFTFNQGYGLCLDYARLLTVFCESQGIPAITISGYPLYVTDGKQDPGDDGYHAWNYIKVDGKWLAFDPTWYSKRNPHDHFMIPLAAYQYEHLPEERALLANPYAPENRDELDRCPVVRQSDMNTIYLSGWEKVVKVQGDVLEVVLYATKEVDLDLHIDSMKYSFNYNTLKFTIGGVESLESQKGKKHKTFHLTRGVNHLQIPLVSTRAEYTLINQQFELSLWAYRADAHEELFEEWASCYDSTKYYAQAYAFFGNWLLKNDQTFFSMSSAEKQHPNWDHIRSEFHNQRMTCSVNRDRDKLIAQYTFTHYTIGGKRPSIQVVMDKDWNCLSKPTMILTY